MARAIRAVGVSLGVALTLIALEWALRFPFLFPYLPRTLFWPNDLPILLPLLLLTPLLWKVGGDWLFVRRPMARALLALGGAIGLVAGMTLSLPPRMMTLGTTLIVPVVFGAAAAWRWDWLSESRKADVGDGTLHAPDPPLENRSARELVLMRIWFRRALAAADWLLAVILVMYGIWPALGVIATWGSWESAVAGLAVATVYIAAGLLVAAGVQMWRTGVSWRLQLSPLLILLVLALIGSAVLMLQVRNAQDIAATALARTDHSATLLSDGRVLVSGGTATSAGLSSIVNLRTAWIYDPARESWEKTGQMIGPNMGHSATLLPDGRALALDGRALELRDQTAEAYDPASGVWSIVANLTFEGARVGAVALTDGRVLVIKATGPGSATTLTADLLDPVTGSSVPTGAPAGFTRPRALPNGEALAIFGSSGTQRYDPKRGAWMSTAALQSIDTVLALHPLPDGRLLAIGVTTKPNVPRDQRGKVEIYEPAADRWVSLPAPEEWAPTVALADGRVFASGRVLGSAIDISSVFDPEKDTWSETGHMNVSRHGHSLTLLRDGRVLAVGGQNLHNGLSGERIASAEIYDPSTGLWIFTTSMGGS